MKLYHATSSENVFGIECEGLLPSVLDGSQYGYKRESDFRGVYGFARIEDAISFAYENNFDALVSFESDDEGEMVADPEYDAGIAYIVSPRYSTIRATVENEIEY